MIVQDLPAVMEQFHQRVVAHSLTDDWQRSNAYRLEVALRSIHSVLKNAADDIVLFDENLIRLGCIVV